VIHCSQILLSISTCAATPGADLRIVNAVCTLLESRAVEAEEAGEDEEGEGTSSIGTSWFLGGANDAIAATAATAVEARGREAAARCTAGVECVSAVLRGQRKLCIALFMSPRLVPALLTLLARPVVEHADRCQASEALALVVDIAGKSW